VKLHLRTPRSWAFLKENQADFKDKTSNSSESFCAGSATFGSPQSRPVKRARVSPSCLARRQARRSFNFRYRSPEHFLDVFKTFYGPVPKAFVALEPTKREELQDDLHALIVRMNRAGEVVITKR
jgi:hypothetical protein